VVSPLTLGIHVGTGRENVERHAYDRRLHRHVPSIFYAGSRMLARSKVDMASKKYTLEELIAQCDLTKPPPAELLDWDNAAPVGREILALEIEIKAD
jgi:hypothetical protein